MYSVCVYSFIYFLFFFGKTKGIYFVNILKVDNMVNVNFKNAICASQKTHILIKNIWYFQTKLLKDFLVLFLTYMVSVQLSEISIFILSKQYSFKRRSKIYLDDFHTWFEMNLHSVYYYVYILSNFSQKDIANSQIMIFLCSSLRAYSFLSLIFSGRSAMYEL